MSALVAAGLGGAHIGLVIRVRVGDQTVIEDEVTNIAHSPDVTWVAFAHVSPNSAHAYATQFGTAFKLDHDDEIEVIEP